MKHYSHSRTYADCTALSIRDQVVSEMISDTTRDHETVLGRQLWRSLDPGRGPSWKHGQIAPSLTALDNDPDESEIAARRSRSSAECRPRDSSLQAECSRTQFLNKFRPGELTKAVQHCSVSNCAQTITILLR